MIEMISNLKQIKDILKKASLKPTYQRIKVMELLLNTYRYAHPTVEMIYKSLINELPVISMTTVYNTLNSLLNKKLIQAITITGTETHYDPNPQPHHHFYCNGCHKIFDIDVTCPLEIDKKRKINGHIIDEVHGYLKGICKDCLKKLNKKGGKNG